MNIYFWVFRFVRFEGVNVDIAIALYEWFHGSDSSWCMATLDHVRGVLMASKFIGRAVPAEFWRPQAAL